MKTLLIIVLISLVVGSLFVLQEILTRDHDFGITRCHSAFDIRTPLAKSTHILSAIGALDKIDKDGQWSYGWQYGGTFVNTNTQNITPAHLKYFQPADIIGYEYWFGKSSPVSGGSNYFSYDERAYERFYEKDKAVKLLLLLSKDLGKIRINEESQDKYEIKLEHPLSPIEAKTLKEYGFDDAQEGKDTFTAVLYQEEIPAHPATILQINGLTSESMKTLAKKKIFLIGRKNTRSMPYYSSVAQSSNSNEYFALVVPEELPGVVKQIEKTGATVSLKKVSIVFGEFCVS